MQRFVTRALFKMAASFYLVSVLLGRKGYGRNGYWPKWFWAENEQMASDAFIFNYALVLARVLTQNGQLKNKDAIFVCNGTLQKSALRKTAPRNASERCEALF